ncbi:uncharacterized protein MELLADRAFT_112142 [Melampsora larici-populina 98AG31]|uniref:Uncharacterized protein n=1 Tax=Melampsora larici-populina (strain 98AG31 / pathotype 3-4-7) TaxID=747676 RepID=F4S5I7_MELLP|nr:uncharacterized protein MELLADRAFT_112142 [Melampsora larici-populina 98AG31]EGG00031.1 hypothetical protein MELLADRAFT_112142 [Melampsora larici-populina 98AG31]
MHLGVHAHLQCKCTGTKRFGARISADREPPGMLQVWFGAKIFADCKVSFSGYIVATWNATGVLYCKCTGKKGLVWTSPQIAKLFSGYNSVPSHATEIFSISLGLAKADGYNYMVIKGEGVPPACPEPGAYSSGMPNIQTLRKRTLWRSFSQVELKTPPTLGL